MTTEAIRPSPSLPESLSRDSVPTPRRSAESEFSVPERRHVFDAGESESIDAYFAQRQAAEDCRYDDYSRGSNLLSIIERRYRDRIAEVRTATEKIDRTNRILGSLAWIERSAGDEYPALTGRIKSLRRILGERQKTECDSVQPLDRY